MSNSLLKKTLVFTIFILFIGISTIPMIGAFFVNDDNKYFLNHPVHYLDENNWWDFDWRYYKQLNISNPRVDYQMLITVFKENGHDDVENGIIDCENKCEIDFSDIRFIDQTHTILLPYWIEETGIDNGDHYSRIWVKTPGDKTIFMYYGNPGAVSLSNGTSTFVLFDDFDSYFEGESNPGEWYIKTCSFETSCSVSCNKNDAYDGKCLEVHGLDAVSNTPKNQYSVASRTINLVYGSYELRVYMKANISKDHIHGIVRIDGTYLINKDYLDTWKLESAKFTANVTDLELVTFFNGYNGPISVYFDDLFIRNYNSSEPYWSYFSDEYNGNIPNPPDIEGPSTGKEQTAYQWIFTSVDPNDDDVFYKIDWGDGNISIWYGLYHSGDPMKQSHVYIYQGIYTIKAKAKDVYGDESYWSELEVIIPRTRESSYLRYHEILERFPMLERLMNFI